MGAAFSVNHSEARRAVWWHAVKSMEQFKQMPQRPTAPNLSPVGQFSLALYRNECTHPPQRTKRLRVAL